MALLNATKIGIFTVKGGWYAICRHFLFCHHDIEITVAEEGTLPRCHECGFQCTLPHTTHQRSRLCLSGRRRNTRRSLTQQIITARTAPPTLTAGNTDLAQVTSFKYLGRWMSLDDSDTMAVTQNIAKARARWGQLCRLLTRQGASCKAMGVFYKATVQAILLHGAETWVLTQPLLCLLRSFHHRCARYLARMVNKQNDDGTWTISPSQLARDAAGFLTIEEYVQRRVNTFLPYARSCPLYRACHESRATQAAATHPIWWAAHEPLQALPAPPRNQVNAEDAGMAQAPALPYPFPAPCRRSPRHEYTIV